MLKKLLVEKKKEEDVLLRELKERGLDYDVKEVMSISASDFDSIKWTRSAVVDDSTSYEGVNTSKIMKMEDVPAHFWSKGDDDFVGGGGSETGKKNFTMTDMMRRIGKK